MASVADWRRPIPKAVVVTKVVWSGLKRQSRAVVLARRGDVVPEGSLGLLLQRDLYDVLLDDLALRNHDDLGGPLAAQPREGAAPGE